MHTDVTFNVIEHVIY